MRRNNRAFVLVIYGLIDLVVKTFIQYYYREVQKHLTISNRNAYINPEIGSYSRSLEMAAQLLDHMRFLIYLPQDAILYSDLLVEIDFNYWDYVFWVYFDEQIDYIVRYFGIKRYYFYQLNQLVYEWYYKISRCMTVDYGNQKFLVMGR